MASDEFFVRGETEVLDAVQVAAGIFSDLDARVEAIDVPEGYQAGLANGLMTTSDAATFHQERLQTRPQDFGTDILQRLQMGAAFTSTEYILARRTQTQLRRRFERFGFR